MRITSSALKPSSGPMLALSLALWSCLPALAQVPSPSHLDLGNAAFARQRYPQALAQYRAALEGGENRPMALFDMGNCLYLLKQTGRALSAYERAIREAPGFARPYLNAGGIYFSLDQVGLALARYHKALALDPENAGAIKMLGECYLKIGDKAQALFYFDRGRRSDPANLDWYYAIAETYVKMQDYLSAQVALHEEMGNPYLALSVLKEASSREGIRRECLMEMARIYCSMGQDGPALDAYQRAAGLGEGRALTGMLNVGKRLFNQGDLARAKEIFARIKTAFPEDMEVSQALADLGS